MIWYLSDGIKMHVDIFWLLIQWYYFLNGLLSGALLGIFVYRNATRKWDWRRKW